jgi:hypothetical protein
VIVIATTVTGITAGVTGTATVIPMGGTTETGAIAEARLVGTHLIIVVAEATLVALQEQGARPATVTMKEAHRTALERTAVGRRYPFVCFIALRLVVPGTLWWRKRATSASTKVLKLFGQGSEDLTRVSLQKIMLQLQLSSCKFSLVYYLTSTSFADVPQLVYLLKTGVYQPYLEE